jgi:hypothetical protein
MICDVNSVSIYTGWTTDMPFCPECHDEFQEWVKVCPDCGRELVEQLPKTGHLKSLPETLVTIADYQFATLAYLSQAKLESEGIQSIVFDDHIINANWLYLIAIGGVKLKVKESDVPEALRILYEVRDTIPGPAERPEDGCPNCRSSNIHYETFNLRLVWGLSAISWILDPILGAAFLLAFPFVKKKWRCYQCGYEWKNNPMPSTQAFQDDDVNDTL